MTHFRWLTTGESHGPGLTAVLEGLPAGVPISEEYIRGDLARRQAGYGRGRRQQIETDWARFRSGVRHGLTLGSPIAMLIENKDWENWQEVMSVAPIERQLNTITRLRPGHADTTGAMKYFQWDARNILERSSARETAARVAVGAVCRRFLEEFGIEIHSHVLSLGGVHAAVPHPVDWAAVEASPVRCADEAAAAVMIAAIDRAKAAGDTLGGTLEVFATGAPMGLGSHIQWDRKLNARIAQALMSINAVKAVSFGAGATVADLAGSRVHDVIRPAEEWGDEGTAAGGVRPWQRRTNNSGGFEGGMTTGEPIITQFVIKPIATLANPLPTVDLVSGAPVQAHYERSDVCVVPAAGVVGESMVAICLAEAMLEKFGGDHLTETFRNYQGYLATLGPRGVE
ncbi:MAG: chorismate synthase [Dehalococcoidia bacterium]|nr:chorismate synthase [Dehalococcoidia bacterium]